MTVRFSIKGATKNANLPSPSNRDSKNRLSFVGEASHEQAGVD